MRFTVFSNFSKLQFVFHIWLLRNFYCGDAHHANYGKHSFNHHFQHCAHSVYQIYSVFKLFEITVFLHILAFTKFLLRWCAPWKLWWTLFKSSFPTLDTLCRLDLQCFQTFRNCCLFCAFWLFRNIYSGDSHDANYCKRSLNNHFQYWTHGAYQIYSVFKLFETAVFSAPLGFYEISTVVMRIMLTRANIV